jgi:hypothetical protein
MQTAPVQHVTLYQRMDGCQGRTGMTDQISQSGQAKLNPLPRNAFGLPVQWLVLSIFVKSDHRDQLRPSPAAWNGVERGRRLADLLAGPAG